MNNLIIGTATLVILELLWWTCVLFILFTRKKELRKNKWKAVMLLSFILLIILIVLKLFN
jgi:hypothetical protein